jgi:hypothetical protein
MERVGIEEEEKEEEEGNHLRMKDLMATREGGVNRSR